MNAVKDFFRYFYTGQIPDGATALQVFALASKFKVQRLKTECGRKALDGIDKVNLDALDVLVDHPDDLNKLVEAMQNRDQGFAAPRLAYASKVQKMVKLDSAI